MTRLHRRIFLHSLGVLMVVGLATSLVFAFGARAASVRDISERLVGHVGALAGEHHGDRAALARRLRKLHEQLGMDVTVRDFEGRVVGAAGRELPALDGRERDEVRAGRVVIHSHPLWYAAGPVRDPSGAVIGTVAASIHRHFGGPGLRRPLLLVTFVLVVVALATLPLAHRISRPIERLTQAARRFGGGDLAARVPEPPAWRRRWWRRRKPEVDEIHELTRAFNEMAERVERSVRDQKELVANVSHELRSPLARIRVALELLPGGDAARRRDVERDFAELDRLIEDVLTTARLDATRRPARLGSLDATRLLGEIVERAARDPLVAGKAVRVAGTSPVRLVADEALLSRAVWNLVENAAKYGVPPITLAASCEGGRITLSVADEGDGIPLEERERVFTPFYRLDRARTPRGEDGAAGGVGLGLTLALRVAEVHGGTIGVGPAATVDGRDRGCRVTIVIPATPPAPS